MDNELKVGERYLFKETHIDGDVPREAVIEEVSPSGDWVKLRHFPGGGFEWVKKGDLAVYEKLEPTKEVS